MPKTNIAYKRNIIWFRVNKDFNNENFEYDIGNSIISFGDSTSSGVNVKKKCNFFLNRLGKKITNKNGKLANYYYSYLPTFDMVQPSIFVSYLY